MDVIKGFFVGEYETEEHIEESTSLRDQLWLDELGWEELSQYLSKSMGGYMMSQSDFESAETVADVVALYKKHAVQLIEDAPAIKMFSNFPFLMSARQKAVLAAEQPRVTHQVWIIFYHAGGTAAWYRKIAKHLDAASERVGGTPLIIPYVVERRGRGARSSAQPATTVTAECELVATLIIQQLLRSDPAQSFVVFGHSMGSCCAYETLKILESRGYVPDCFVVASKSCPILPVGEVFVGDHTTEQFLSKMAQVYKNDSLLKLWKTSPETMERNLPMLRNDMIAFENYQLPEGETHFRTSAPIIACRGRDDPRNTDEEMQMWASLSVSRKPLIFRSWEGGHFFHQDNDEFYNWVVEQVQKLL